jgi:hypothetical protein
MSKNCGSCKYWEIMEGQAITDSPVGMCKRHPPVCAGMGVMVHRLTGQKFQRPIFAWPDLQSSACCGEYEPKITLGD